MRRILVVLASVILILLVTAVICVLNMDWVVGRILSSKFKTKVTIEDIFFQPFDEINVRDMKVYNPSRFLHSPYALEVTSIDIHAPFRTYLKTVMMIDWIVTNNLTLTVDFVKGVSNWEILMKRISSSPTSNSRDSYAIIKKLIFKNLIVKVAKGNGHFETHVIKKLVLKDIQTNKGDLATRLTQAILRQAFFNSENFIKIPLDTAKGTVNQAFDTFDFINPFSSGK